MNNKGITLVAMVITIIVMLILAGVSISMVVGDNGVLTKAQQGSVRTVLSSIESDIGLAVNSVQTDYMGEFAESTSKAGDKVKYLTIKKLNDYLVECKMLTNQTDSSDELNITVATFTNEEDQKGNDSTALTDIWYIKQGIGNKDSNPDGYAEGTSDTKTASETTTPDGYIDSIGYVCNCIYFSNGKNSKTYGGDLYVGIVHFEKGFLVLDDIGIAKKNPKDCMALNQGELANATTGEKFNANNLNVEWLNKGIGDSLTE